MSDLLKDPAYFEKARQLYDWQKRTLTNGKGKVYDCIYPAKPGQKPRIDQRTFTYNQGTYIGASTLFYLRTGDVAFLEEAKRSASWTRQHLGRGRQHILLSERQGDGGAFKGILVRNLHLLIHQGGATEYLSWMRTNATVAWSHRRADGIMGYDWSAPAPTGTIQSQSAASAVSLLLCFPTPLPDTNPARPKPADTTKP